MDCDEIDERAAIREYDGGLPREQAERAALADLADRQASHKPGAAGEEPQRDSLAALRAKMDAVGRQMQGAEGQEKDELLARWFELAYRIIDVRKGVDDGNAGRLSGERRY